jgi:ribosomal protein S15P/S13E
MSACPKCGRHIDTIQPLTVNIAEGALCVLLDKQAAHIQKLTVELEAERKDAARYRKLRDVVSQDAMLWDCLRTCSENAFPTLIDDYRTAIDSAISRETKG